MDLAIRFVGKMKYLKALDLQSRLRTDVLGGGAGRFLLLHHPPVITSGRRDAEGFFVESPQTLRREGIGVYKTDRAGLLTYHGPGQLVGYPIWPLDAMGLSPREHVTILAEAIIVVLEELGIDAYWDDDNPGVWVGTSKIAAVGVRTQRGVTTHGFALNVAPSLAMFDKVVACGIADRGVTSVANEIGTVPSLRDLARDIVDVTLELLPVPVRVLPPPLSLI